MMSEPTFIKFDSVEAVNEHLKNVDLNKLAANHFRKLPEGGFQCDTLAIQLFVGSLLRETFYKA
jgi:hypothetical protein